MEADTKKLLRLELQGKVMIGQCKIGLDDRPSLRQIWVKDGA